MSDQWLERRLRETLRAAVQRTHESPDLFARVTRSIEEDRARRRWRARVAGAVAAYVGTVVAIGASASDIENGRVFMDWWVLELLTNAVLVSIVLVLGPFIKRFGRSYAADVFRANPRTGKSYLVLIDVAYYLVFLAFILATINFKEPNEWRLRTGADFESEVERVAGMVLLLGILHGLNVVGLPVIGRLLSLNRRLDDGEPPARGQAAPAPGGTVLPGGGSWVLRIEPAASTVRPRAEKAEDDPGPPAP